MQPKPETTHIVISTDSNYLVHSRVLLRSIADNHRGGVIIHIFAFELTSIEKIQLANCLEKDSVIFYDLTEDSICQRLFEGKKLTRDRSLAAYARLLIPELLPHDIQRCIYMDVDAVVYGDLSELSQIALKDYAIAGVQDTNPINRHLAVGLTESDSYINSGMILWNLEYCREHKVVDVFAKFISAHNGNVDAMDQGTLNGCLSKSTKTLPPRFNAMTPFFQMNSKQINSFYHLQKNYTDDEIIEARQHPVFIHFTPNLTSRPCNKGCRHPLRRIYWHYRHIDDPQAAPAPDNRSFKIKLAGTLFYLLPFNLFRFIFSR